MNGSIDYGCGITNIDLATGIRFGVIPMNDLGECSFDSFEAEYGDPQCPDCFGAVVESCEEARGKDYYCAECESSYWSDQCFGDEALGHTLDDGEYQATLDEQGDVFILKSPYYTYASFCSPCAPGAVHLRNPNPDGAKGYCFGKDWFENETAPYPVYRVSDNSLVE